MLGDVPLTLLSIVLNKGSFRHLGFSLGARRHICNVLKQHFDVVHIHGVFSYIGTLAAKASREAGIPYIVRPAGILNAELLKTGRTKWKKALYRRQVRPDLEQAAGLHATSDREKADLEELLSHPNIFTLPHGVEIPTDEEIESGRGEFRATFPQLADKPFILFLSRIAAKKRIDLLIQAFKAAAQNHPDLQLVIAGSDHGYLETAKQLAVETGISKRIHFPGFLQGELKTGALAQARLIALTSIDENFGIIIPEAMAHGTPVLVTEGVDSHKFVDAADAGLTVACEQEAVNDGLAKLLQSDDLQAMGTRGRQYALDHLGWSAVMSQYEEIYRSIITAHSK
jgi:glycosyltransferase involved in cell wall biosynthesis